ncbi:MAG TPA: tyrosine-protein phosphatase [Bryobacteraceae bacterium]|nr:tyrosine-protein phosphatase [Bryobacteraceae bacterium]
MRLALCTGLALLCARAACLVASIPGVPHAARVDSNIYRGGQPSTRGFRNLAKAGIKTVLDLRASASRASKERDEVQSAGMRYVQVPLHDDAPPSQANVRKALSVLNDSSRWPVFVHCDGGKDRTGMIIACYRISHDGWSHAQALGEAKDCASRDLKPAMRKYVMRFHPQRLAAAETAR